MGGGLLRQGGVGVRTVHYIFSGGGGGGVKFRRNGISNRKGCMYIGVDFYRERRS